jgi:excisionase family DNA binding protein
MIELTQIEYRLHRIEQILNSNKKNQWITLHEAIEYTSLSDSSIRRAFYSGKLKASRATGKLLFKISDLEKWLSNE